MRIRSISPFLTRLPLAKPFKMSNVTIVTAENLLVRVEDTDGNVGWGEACSGPMMTGDLPAGLAAAARYMGRLLVGVCVDDPSTFAEKIQPLIYGNRGAKSALEMAVYDLAATRAGVPISELLGGALRRKIPALFILAAGNLSRDLEMAKRKVDDGFVAFKVKVGTTTVDRDLERCAAVRTLLGREVRISADANEGYSLEEALQFASSAEDVGLDFIEQPIRGTDLEGMAQISAATSVPLCADEGIHSVEDIRRHYELGAARGASLKTIKLGGLSPTMNAGRMMCGLNMSINLAGKIAESSIAGAAIIQLGAALPQIEWDASVTCQYLANDVTKISMRPVGGMIRLPDRPGLGIEIDVDKLATFATPITE